MIFLGSSLADLEPKLQLFEVDDQGDAGNDDLLHRHLRSGCTRLVPGWHYIDLKNCQKSQFGGKIGKNCLVKKMG